MVRIFIVAKGAVDRSNRAVGLGSALVPMHAAAARPRIHRWRCELSKSTEISGHKSHCPRCGLTFEITVRDGGPELGYDFAAWNRVCRSPLLGGPSMCLAQACELVAPIDIGLEYRDSPVVKPLG